MIVAASYSLGSGTIFVDAEELEPTQLGNTFLSADLFP
jgi:hypothetical protein